MPSITIRFEHNDASNPKYKFGDKVAVSKDCPPKNWLTGEVVGMILETEIFGSRWSYSVKLDFPPDYTEDYQESELVPEAEVSLFQAERDYPCKDHTPEKAPVPPPKFQPGMRVKLNAESGFESFGENGVVVSSKYISNESWCGWTYLLHSENLGKPVEIGEIWLELVPSTTSVKP